jgi:hypothetical protein
MRRRSSIWDKRKIINLGNTKYIIKAGKTRKSTLPKLRKSMPAQL